MAMETCSGCETRFAVGLLRCPRCGVVAPLYASRVRPADVTVGSASVEPGFRQLRAAAKERGLSGAGTAAELAARIAEHDAKAGAA
jgi:hypothetical protein